MTDVDNQKISFGNERFLGIVKTIDEAETLEQLLASVPSLIPDMIGIYYHFGAVGAFDFKDLSDFHEYNVPELMKKTLQIMENATVIQPS